MRSVSSRVPRVALLVLVGALTCLLLAKLLVHKDARRSEKQAIDELEVQSMSHKTYHRIGHGISKNKGSFGQPTCTAGEWPERDGGVELSVDVEHEQDKLPTSGMCPLERPWHSIENPQTHWQLVQVKK